MDTYMEDNRPSITKGLKFWDVDDSGRVLNRPDDYHGLKLRSKKLKPKWLTDVGNRKPYDGATTIASRFGRVMVNHAERIKGLTISDVARTSYKNHRYGWKGDYVEDWMNVWVLCATPKGYAADDPADYPIKRPLGRRNILNGGGEYNTDYAWVHPEFPDVKETMTARELYTFSYNYAAKRAEIQDWDLMAIEQDFDSGEPITRDNLENLASEAVLKFLTRIDDTGSIRKRGDGTTYVLSPIKNGFRYLASCVRSAIMDYRREQAERRLSIVPYEVLEYVDSLNLQVVEPNLLLEVYDAVKSPDKMTVKMDFDTIKSAFIELGITLQAAHLRAVTNAMLGKNRGVNGSKTTKRYIRHVSKKLKEIDSDVSNALYEKLNGVDIKPDLPTMEQANALYEAQHR